MGEWSKKVGEYGEKIAGEFLHTIGWGSAQSGIPLACVKPDQHRRGERDRTTHGIDYLISYQSPLIDGVGQNVVVSVKYSAEPYPDSLSRIFKQHFIDLAHTLECFKNSEARRNTSRSVGHVGRIQVTGLNFLDH